MAENQTISIAFQFEVVADEQYPADPATLGEVGRYVAQELRKMGYPVEPIYSGERGGELFEFIKNVAVVTWEHRDAIMEMVKDAGIFIGVIGAAQKVVTANHKEPIQITIEISDDDGASLKSEGVDDESKKEMQKKLPTFIEQSPKAKKRKFTAKVQQPSKRRRK